MDERNPQRGLEDLLAEFDNAMLLTRGPDGRMRSRPMVIVDVRGDRTIRFATPVDSPWADEFERDPQVTVVLQSGSRSGSITGAGRIIADRSILDRLWSTSWKVWLPRGPEDPALCLIAVEAVVAEFWDAAGGQGKYVFHGAGAPSDEIRPGPERKP